MNKKVFISMLVLTISFLVSFYVLKIFFPQEFVMSIQNERLIQIGNFIDNNLWCEIIVSSLTSFIIYWFYLCLVSRKLYLRLKEIIMVLITIVIIQIADIYAPQFINYITVTSMLVLPCFTNAKLRDVAIVYSIHGLAQMLSLGIRNLTMYLFGINSIICIILTAECYLWLILFYVIYNYKKKEN